jgi:hypothetical protein
VVTRRLWKVSAKPGKAYSIRRASPRIVEVLEQGSEVIHRERVSGDPYALYEIDKGWLVEKTSPKKVEALQRASAERQAKTAERAAAARRPAFRAFLREAEAAFGPPTKVRACDVSTWSFTAPKLRTAGSWAKQARDVGAAATIYFPEPAVPTLRVVAGPVSMLVALLDWNLYGPETLRTAIQTLDHAAGLSFDWIGPGEQFSIRLARAPARPEAHAKALAEELGGAREITAALRKRAWIHR